MHLIKKLLIYIKDLFETLRLLLFIAGPIPFILAPFSSHKDIIMTTAFLAFVIGSFPFINLFDRHWRSKIKPKP